MRTFNHKRRGNAMVEFALAFPILYMAMAGTFHFGYVFMVYDGLQTAVRGGGRYASMADFDSPDGSDFIDGVKNMVVYGDTNPDVGSDAAVVAGLTTAHVVVDASDQDGSGKPLTVSVSINGFTLETFVASYQLASKPASTFVYQGQFK